jgi:hypothetical protein
MWTSTHLVRTGVVGDHEVDVVVERGSEDVAVFRV